MKAHAEKDEVFHMEVTTHIGEIKGDIKVIKENHLAHIQNDMWWVKWLLLGLVGAIGSIVTAVLISFLLSK